MVEKSARINGVLYVVATPIGNIEDITLRALTVLKTVDYILAEDTRHSINLLTHFGIQKPLQSFHMHNERDKTSSIIQALKEGTNYALISDAGTPLISDPGFPLVKEARAQGIDVIPLPGASALTTALSAAGVSCDQFTFFGFLPARHAARIEALKRMLSLGHTVVCYESKHRILESVRDVGDVFGDDANIVLVKELTKTFERFVAGTCCEVSDWLSCDELHCKGEFVLIIPPKPQQSDTAALESTLSVLLAELPLKQAVRVASQLTGENKNALYQLALSLNKKDV